LKKIDQSIYKLYDLVEEEIEIIDGNINNEKNFSGNK